MVDTHSYSFFGQKVGLIIQSNAKNEPFIFFRLIKSKSDGSWEKPSGGEGKIIKFSIEELVWIIRVLNKEVKSWSSYHTFKNSKTQISIKWEEEEKGKLWIHIDSYSKVLEYAQFTILTMLLQHILKEKIEFATIPNRTKKNNPGELNKIVVQEEVITDATTIEKIQTNDDNDENPKKMAKIVGSIKSETSKALLIQFNNGSEVWIPKSTVHSGFNNIKDLVQDFTIDSWILKKNKVIS